jgi:hypothetical protein
VSFLSFRPFHRHFVIAAWAGFVLALAIVRVAALSSPVSVPEIAAWLFLGGAPVIAASLMGRGAESSTMAQVLYDAEHAPPMPKQGRS